MPPKRKDPPPSSEPGGSARGKPQPGAKRARMKPYASRAIRTQPTSAAFPDNEIRVGPFVAARAREITALEDGIVRAKGMLTKRAFSEVPRELRRRTASHNVKRVPKRLRPRAKREMEQDKTPRRQRRERRTRDRLREETARKLKRVRDKVRRAKAEKKAEREGVPPGEEGKIEVTPMEGVEGQDEGKGTQVKTRKARIKQAKLAQPPTPVAKFKKRQINKTWLPTHMYHTKRAHMTPPKEPLWRFALPITPTVKSYRPTHRAATMRGAVAWDASYMSTIGLEGREDGINGILKALGVGAGGDPEGWWGPRGGKWRDGLRVWEGWLYERQAWPNKAIAPATVIWCAREKRDAGKADEKKAGRKAFVRVHPAGFMRLWEEVVRLGKVQQPSVKVEDLRFELGSIEVVGPAATEALISALRPVESQTTNISEGSPEKIWPTLGGLVNPGSLSAGALLAFEVSDPRLRFPPRSTPIPSDPEGHSKFIQTLADWPIDRTQGPATIYDRGARLASQRALPSQKNINRRKSLAMPGEFPEPRPTDPRIPVLLYASRGVGHHPSAWTVLLPWKCVEPVWRSVMFYPISTGGNPRLGGLREKQQIAFEAGTPWFPADYPGTHAGLEWEMKQRRERKLQWERRPRGKRTEYTSLNLGNGRKGEIGLGWACDWERLVAGPPSDRSPDKEASKHVDGLGNPPPAVTQLPTAVALDLISPTPELNREQFGHAIFTVRLNLLSRGVPTACARIYRLPTNNAALRQHWLSLVPARTGGGGKVGGKPRVRPLPTDDVTVAADRSRQLAAALLAPPPPQPGDARYPVVPDEVDLIGFVTTGNFNLGEGKGTGIGGLLLSKVVEGEWVREERRLCVVREAGQMVGRLARWEVV